VPPIVIAVVLGSAVMHAVWNLLVRGRGDKQTMVYRMLLIIVAGGLIPAVISEFFGPSAGSMTPKLWLIAAGAGMANGLYYVCMARSLAAADFGTVFPIIRGLPIVLIAVGDLALGRPPSAIGWMAMAMVASGCGLTPQKSFRDLSHHHYWRPSSLWMLGAALAAVGYTLPDKWAMELMRGDAQMAIGSALRYQYFHLAASMLTVAVAGRSMRVKAAKAAKTDGEHKPVGWLIPGVAAALNFTAYSAILVCYQMVRHAGYIWAMRQFSIVVGVLLAFAIFKERGRLVRLTGAVLITAGLVLIGLYCK
jgi:drug/metabolite transporter (DMT)-like permease